MTICWQAIPFPFDALPHPIYAAVHDLVVQTKTPLPLAIATVLASVSLAFEGDIDVVRPGCEPSSVGLYILVLASSGERKSATTRKAFAARTQFEAMAQKMVQQQGGSCEAALTVWRIVEKSIHAKIKKAADKRLPTDLLCAELEAHLERRPARLLAPKMTFTDASPEAIAASITARWPFIGLVADEGSGLLNGRALQNMPLLTKLWDGDRLNIDRVDGTVEPIADPRMTLLAMIQPGRFSKFMKKKGEEALELGLFARTLITYPFSTQGFRFMPVDGQPTSGDGLQALNARLLHVLQRTHAKANRGCFDRKNLTMSPDAKRYWIEFCNWTEMQCAPTGIYAHSTAYASKLGEHLARLAALFAYVHGDVKEITLDDIERARATLDFFTHEHMRIFAPAPPMPPTQADAYLLRHWFAEKMCKDGNLRFPRNKIIKYGPAPLRNKERLYPALWWLQKEGAISIFLEGKFTIIYCNKSYFLGTNIDAHTVFTGAL